MLFVVVWAIATLGGFVSKTFLADPITMVKVATLITGWASSATWDDCLARCWGLCDRSGDCFALGVAMGAYKPVEAFFEPFVSFARYLPASAFIPLLILWVGIGEAQNWSLSFSWHVFHLAFMIAVTVGNTRVAISSRRRTHWARRMPTLLGVCCPGCGA